MSTTINQSQQRQMPTILEAARSTGDFTTLIQIVEIAGLSETLKTQSPLTFFAPSDEAFRKLPTGTLEGLKKDLPKLKAILNYHLVDRKINMDELRNMSSEGRIANITTLQGSALVLKTHQNILMKSEYVNDSKIVKSDIEASNGVLHVIDRVLIPTQA
ncbi:MAG: fasciclin domain-containing protein [Nitrososphaerales archaeon]